MLPLKQLCRTYVLMCHVYLTLVAVATLAVGSGCRYRSPKPRFLVRYLWLLMLFAVAAVGVGVLNPMYWCCIGLLMLFAVAAVGCGCAEPHVLMLFRIVNPICCCSGWLWVCGTPGTTRRGTTTGLTTTSGPSIRITIAPPAPSVDWILRKHSVSSIFSSFSSNLKSSPLDIGP